VVEKINYNCVFQRVEKKYLLTDEKYNLFIDKIKPYMKLDKYGMHTICNIYYDTDNYDLILKSLEKPKYKEKFRIRSYGVPSQDDKVFLEIKKKYKGIVYKRRISLTLKEARGVMENHIKLKANNQPLDNQQIIDYQILKEIEYFLNFYDLHKKVYLAYDREAYYGIEDNNIRLTVDKNIRSRFYDLDLNLGDYGELLLSNGYHLIEIKVPITYPIWLVKILSELEIYPVSFSKYGNVYIQNLKKRSNLLCSQVY